MNIFRIGLSMVLPLALVACVTSTSGGGGGGGGVGGGAGGEEEVGGGGGESAVCPDVADPTVHYISEDPAQCGQTDCGGPESDCIPCSVDQEYFENECGCGCIDTAPVCPDPGDPAVHYISQDPAQCGQTDCGAQADCIPCDAAQEYFENDCGCGCIDPA